MNDELRTLVETAALLACRLLPCALLWGQASLTGLPRWALLAPAMALVIALAPSHPVAMSCTVQTAVIELLLGVGIALAGQLCLSLIALFGGWTDESARNRAPLWRQQLPPLLLGLWAMSGGATVLVEELDAALALYPVGQSGDALFSSPGRLLALIAELAVIGAFICLPVALLKVGAELVDALTSRWSGHPLRPTRPLLPLAIALLLLIAASHMGDRAFRALR